MVTAIVEPARGNNLIISPSPAKDEVMVRYTGNSTRFTAIVTDINGRQVLSTGTITNSCLLDMRKLNAGMYIIKIRNTMTGEIINRIIIKQ